MSSSASTASRVRQAAGSLNFFRLHLLIGLFLPLVIAGILYGSNGENHIRYVDLLFMAVSALTTTGLTTTYVSVMTRWQQVLLYLLMTLGSIPSVSVITLIVRRQKFKKYLRHAPQHFQSALEDDNEAGASSSARTKNDQRNQKGDGRGSNDGHTSKPKNESPQIGSNALPRKQTYDRGGFPNPIIALYHSASSQLRQRYLSPSSKLGHHSSENHHKKREYLSFDHRSRVHRNSHFPDLSGEERSEIGQLELRAMTLLVGIMLGYMLVLQLFAVIIWAPYFSAGHYTDPDFVSGFETSRTWFSFFQASSMFNNCGLSLVDSNLTNFQTTYIMLVPAIFLMYGGYFGLPIALRLILWILSRVISAKSKLAAPLFFLRDHPRRVTYMMFPSYETWVLGFVVICLTMTDWVLFEILNIGLYYVYSDLSSGQRAINGLVQAVSVRSSGFYTVLLSGTSPALHISYIFTMIIGVYPIAMAIRATNVYEEKALGIHDADEHSEKAGIQHVKTEGSYVSEHLRQQLAYDVWWVVLCTFIICAAERGKLLDESKYSYFTVFAVIFEVASAYANVGFSLGVPYSDSSFATSFTTLSKLVLMAAMIRGRTRELPIVIDRAIMTPEELKQHGDPPEHETGDRGQQAAGEAEAEG